jgi:hypothetical protein
MWQPIWQICIIYHEQRILRTQEFLVRSCLSLLDVKQVAILFLVSGLYGLLFLQ